MVRTYLLMLLLGSTLPALCQSPILVCGSVCGSCDVSHSNNAPNPAEAGTYYTQAYNLYNRSSNNANNIEIRAERAYLNSGSTNVLSSINYQQTSTVYFTINRWQCGQVQVTFKISPSNNGQYRIYYGLYNGTQRLGSLGGGDLYTDITIASCDPPSWVNVNPSSVTSNSAIATFTPTSNATSTTIEWGSRGIWNSQNTNSSSVSMTGLTPNSPYVVYGKSHCGSMTSGLSVNIPVYFTTDPTGSSPPPPCTIPGNLRTTDIRPSYARFNWNAVSGVSFYEIRYRRRNSSVWEPSIQTTNTNYFVYNLKNSAEYEWQVRAQCTAASSNWSTGIIFKTLCEKPDANFSISQTDINVHEAFSLTDLSSNVPTQWTWTIQDGTIGSYTSQNPSGVSFTKPGPRDITLLVQNSCGQDQASVKIDVIPDYGNKESFDIANTRKEDHSHIEVTDPVNPYTGEFHFTVNLITLIDIGGPYPFNITYHSKASQNSIFGQNWDHNYHYQLVDHGDLWTVTQGVGQRQYFIPFGNGSRPLYSTERDTMYRGSGGTYILEKTDGTKIRFSNTQTIIEITNRNGHVIKPFGGTTRMDFPGNRYVFTNKTNGLVTRMFDRASRTALFEYDANNNLSKITTIDGDTIQFLYQANHRLTTVIAPNGDTALVNTYRFGKVTSQRDGEGNRTRFIYNSPQTGATQVINPEGYSSYYYHDSLGQLTKYIDEEGNTTQYVMNDWGKPAQIINANLDTTWLFYDANGNMTRIEDPLHNGVTVEYGSYDLPEKIIDPLGEITEIDYDDHGNRMEVRLPNGGTIKDSVDDYGRVLWSQLNQQRTSFSYQSDNSGGGLEKVYDDDGNASRQWVDSKSGLVYRYRNRASRYTNYTRKSSGLITQIKHADNSYDDFIHDANTNLLQHINRNRDTTRYAYYRNNWLKSITNAKGQVTSINYYKTGWIKSMQTPNGLKTRWTYYPNGWIKTVTDTFGTIQYQYDAIGQPTQVTDKAGRVSSYSYYPDGRIKSETNAEKQTTRYRYNARDLVKILQPLDQTLRFDFGESGELTKAYDGLDGYNQLSRDKRYNLTKVWDANGHLTKTRYNNRSLPISTLLPTNDSFLTTYDNLGLIKTFTDANGIGATVLRDANNRIRDISYDNFAWVEYSHSPEGDLTHAENSHGRQEFEYDELRQLIQETGVYSDTIKYHYDGTTNERTEIIYPGNKKVTYTYTRGQVTRVEDWLGNWADFIYYDHGPLKFIFRSNGVITRYQYDDLDQVTRLQTGMGTNIIAKYDLTRDSLNRIVDIELLQPVFPAYKNHESRTDYDESDRPQSGYGLIYRNDKNGNLQYFADSTDSFSYGFAEDNRVTFSACNGDTILRTYSATRRPVKLVKNGQEERYTFSHGMGLPVPIQRRNGNNDVTQHYIHGPDGLAWMIDAQGEAHFYVVDHIGHVVALSDENGTVTDSFANDMWGGSVIHLGNTEQPFGYMGGYGTIHLGNGQYITGARDYLGSIGRFVSADQYPMNLANTQSNQRFSMAYNSPANFVDPSGYVPQWAGTGNSTHQSSTPLFLPQFDAEGAFWSSLKSAVTSPTVLLDGLQTGFDAAGLAVPLAGDVLDVANAGIYTLRGDHVNAGLSLAAAVPFVGIGATAAKFGKKVFRAFDFSGAIAQNGAKHSLALVETPMSILKPNGTIIGKRGSRNNIRDLEGGMDAARSYWARLNMSGTKPNYGNNYKGTFMDLNSGGTIGFREYSTKSPNTAATINIEIPGVFNGKLKFND